MEVQAEQAEGLKELGPQVAERMYRYTTRSITSTHSNCLFSEGPGALQITLEELGPQVAERMYRFTTRSISQYSLELRVFRRGGGDRNSRASFDGRWRCRAAGG